MRRFILAGLSLLLPSGPALAKGPDVVGFGLRAITAHRISGDDTVQVDRDRVDFGGVTLLLTIDPQGNVIDAASRRRSYESKDPGPALAAVRRWKFRPFLYRGKPVTATGLVELDYRPRDVWGNRNAKFPAIDYRSLKIGLTRSPCFGSCPTYSLTIDGDGTVTYTNQDAPWSDPARQPPLFGRNTVLVPGTHHGRIDRAALNGLIAKFRAARFFELKNSYRAEITDNPNYALSFSTGGRTMTVQDYVGPKVGMPMAAHDLEDEIDRVAGSARWVQGNGETVATLIAEGFDPKSNDAVVLASTALHFEGGAVVLRDLIAAGLPLDREIAIPLDGPKRPLGQWLLLQAVSGGHADLARSLIARGWLARVPREDLDRVFAEGAGGCDADLARALVAGGADPNSKTPVQGEPRYRDGGATALQKAILAYGPCRDRQDKVPALVGALLALGTDPNARDVRGRTAVFGADDVGLLDQLIAHGARVDLKDGEGRGPVFSSFDDSAILTLLEAGADPSGMYDYNGAKTLRQMAHESNMPGTLAWLDAHGVK